MDLFNTYRKMFASFDSEDVVWWYTGVVLSHKEGLGQIPQTSAETIMVYRTLDVDENCFTIDWQEVGYFRDITTGEVMDEGWFNPFAWQQQPYPKTFIDGPARFTIKRSADGSGIDVHLVQNQARIDGVKLAVSVNEKSVGLVQTESKTRTFHRPDGSLPDLDSPEAVAIETVLSIWSDLAAVGDVSQGNVASRGYYTSGSRLAGGTSSWAGTKVHGQMYKGRVDEKINPEAWSRLAKAFPHFFKNDRVAPDWN